MLFWSWESEKPIFTIFPDFLTKKWAGNMGITSETTVLVRFRSGSGPVWFPSGSRHGYIQLDIPAEYPAGYLCNFAS